MGHVMADDERRAFLSAGTRTGKVAVVTADGSPRVAPIWFLLDGDVVVFNTGAETVKGKSMALEPRVAISVDDDNPPFSFVVMHGKVELIDDLAQVKEWATRIAARYMGPGRAEEFGARNGVPGELLVRFYPERITAVAAISD